MKAIVISQYGGPEHLELRDMPPPAPATNEDLVQVHAAGVNFADTMTASGGYPGTPKPPVIAGREFCGARTRDGVRVMGYAQWGAFAQLIAGKSSLLWPVPNGWSDEEGAAFPVNFFTAYLAYWKAGLLDHTNGRPNTPAKVLIHAVAGGVGTAAVQIGKILGVEMYGTSSSDEKLQRAKQLGLQHGINYRHRDYADAIRDLTGGKGVDAVFEMLGGEHTAKSVGCLADFGRLIAYGSATGERGRIDVGSLYAKGTSVHGLWLTYLSANAGIMTHAWEQLSEWIAQGKLRPVVGKVLPMDRAADAYKLMLERKNVGKVVLRIS